MRRWELTATLPHPTPHGWVFEVEDRQHGPYATEDAAHAGALRLFQRWAAKAKRLGGSAWKASATRWCLNLPDDVVVEGGRPFEGVAVARH